MAGGKLSGRQKMINVMYLVLMAMLALNVSKEVLVAFGRIDKSITTTSNQLNTGSALIYGGLAEKAKDNPKKYASINKEAIKLKQASNKVISVLDSLTLKVEESVGGRNPETGKLPWKDMDGSQADEILFPGGDTSIGEGDDLVNAITEYRDELISLINNLPKDKASADDKLKMIELVNSSLSTDDVKGNDGVVKPWVKHTFEHYPVASVIAFISQIKADVRNSENKLVSKMGGLSDNITTVNAFEALPIANSTTVMQGGKFKARLVLAAYDSMATPEMFVWKTNKAGRKIGNEKKLKVKNGAGVVDIAAGSVGDQYWGGVIKVKNEKGESTSYEFKGKYAVTQPAVVISAEKMNVFYRGVENPVSVSVPGVSSEKITVTANGVAIKKTAGGRYMFNATRVSGKNVKVVVSAKMPSGDVKTFPGQVYRVKGLPEPVGSIAKKTGSISLPKANLKALKIEAIFKDFDFDLPLRVSQFTLKVIGRPALKVNGNKMNDAAKALIDKARGEVTIRDIKVKIVGNSTYRIASVAPIIVTLR